MSIEAAQQEFNSLIQGQTPETAPEQQTAEEMLEFDLGEQKFKVPYSYELPIKHNGAVAKAPLKNLVNAWRERQHLTDKYSKFKTEREEFDNQRKQFQNFEELHKKYGDLEEWSLKNPDQWERLYGLFQERDRVLSATDDNPLAAEVANMRKELMDLRQFRQEFAQDAESRQMKADAEFVQKDIAEFDSKFCKKYGIDLNETDEDGVSLTARICQYGIDNKIPDFTPAALAFLSDRLLTSAEQAGRKGVVETTKNQRKAGIMGRSDTPLGGETTIDPRKLSENDRMRAALADFDKLTARG